MPDANAPILEPGWYLGANCHVCDEFVPLFRDRAEGNGAIFGKIGIKATCSWCGLESVLVSDEMRSVRFVRPHANVEPVSLAVAL